MLMTGHGTSPAGETMPPKNALARVPATIITGARSWSWANLREVWKSRELIYFLALRDVKVRYKQTALGAAWAIIQPLMMMAIFTILFGRIAGLFSGSIPYPLFALGGLLPWTYFSTSVSSASNSVVGAERLVNKVYFPRLTLPLAATGPSLVDFCVASGLMVPMMAWYAILPGARILLLPLVLLLILTLAIGLGTLLAALNVAFRDFKHVIPFMLQIGMYATPAIYLDLSPAQREKYRWFIALNPMNSLVEGFRASLLNTPFSWTTLAFPAAISLAILMIGVGYFHRVQEDFADLL